MTLYVAFAKWTGQGIRNFWDTLGRFEEVKKFSPQFGVEIVDLLWIPGGPHDMISIVEARDYAAFAAFALTLESMGGVRFTWIRGHRPDEMREVIAKSR